MFLLFSPCDLEQGAMPRAADQDQAAGMANVPVEDGAGAYGDNQGWFSLFSLQQRFEPDVTSNLFLREERLTIRLPVLRTALLGVLSLFEFETSSATRRSALLVLSRTAPKNHRLCRRLQK